MVIDAAGAVHVIGTTEDEGRGLIHLTNSSGVWTEEEVTTPPAKGSDVGIGVATDADGSMWVAFARFEFWNPCVFGCGRRSRLDGRYVINNASGAWSEPARLPEELGFEKVMAVRDGVLHVAYRLDGNEPRIGYATNSGGGWHYEIVGPGFGPDLALGGAGDPRVVMTVGDPANYSITLALRSDDAWQVEPVPDSTGDEGPEPHVAVNAADATVVQHAHFELDSGFASFLTTFDGTSWSAPVEIAPVRIDEMALGPDDAVHVLFAVAETDSSDGLWWARLHRDTRVDHLIDPSVRFIEDAPTAAQSFALDAAGLPHIVFAIPFDEGREGTWYASGEAP